MTEQRLAHRKWSDYRQEKLADPLNCAHYLMAAAEDSKESFLYALKNVNEAQGILAATQVSSGKE